MLKTQKLARCGLLLALLCLSSQLKIPLPGVPISLQWTMVVLIAFLLSWKEAMLTVSLYVVLGFYIMSTFDFKKKRHGSHQAAENPATPS